MPSFPSAFGGGDVPIVDITITADDNNIRKLLKCWLSPAQYLEGVLQQLYSERSIDTAIGAQLDVLGRLVGQARDGLNDDTYRRYIRARISVNRSKGRIQDIIRVADLVVDDVHARFNLKNQGRAAYVLKIEDVATTFALSLVVLDLVKDATAAGVRVIIESNADVPANAFTCALFGGGDAPGKGFGSLPQLDLAPLTANVETVVRHRDSRVPTLALVADGAGAGSLTNVGDAWTFHFQSGVTTVANFETAINASSALLVLTPDGVGTLAAGDVLASTAFVKPVTGGKFSSASSS